MGDVVRPNFRSGLCVIPRVSAPGDGEPRKVYGNVGCYRVALYCDDHPGTHPMLKLRLMRLGTDKAHILATLPVTQEGHFEAHAIAAAVLQTLRLTTIPDTKA
jgi:hypothetical protein